MNKEEIRINEIETNVLQELKKLYVDNITSMARQRIEYIILNAQADLDIAIADRAATCIANDIKEDEDPEYCECLNKHVLLTEILDKIENELDDITAMYINW